MKGKSNSFNQVTPFIVKSGILGSSYIAFPRDIVIGITVPPEPPPPPLEGYPLFGFGYNGDYVLGLGDEEMRTSPVLVDSELWITLGGSYYASLGVRADGTLWSWGFGGFGSLGGGDFADRPFPAQVGTDSNWAKISVGGSDHVLAIRTDGTLWSWGLNGSGELGRGLPTYEDPGDPYFPTPGQFGSDTWQMVSAGNNHSLAIRSDGTLWTAGYDSDGQLGQGPFTTDYHPTFGQVGTDTDWAYVSGGAYTSMGIKSDGTLWGWGDGGNPSAIGLPIGDYDVPTQVGVLTGWSKVACGSFFSVALREDGTLWSTGSGFHGQLGHGNTNSVSVFTQIGTDDDWIDISCVGNHCLARKIGGGVWSWGDNSSWGGQLGLGDTTDRHSPTQITTLANGEFLFAGWANSLVLAESAGS